MPKDFGEISSTNKGGVLLLDSKLSSDDTEEREHRNTRDPDALNVAIGDVLGRDVRGYIINHTFEITNPLTRPTYVSFDRHYPEFNLLIDFFETPRANVATKDEIESEIKDRTAFCAERKIKYLPILDGNLEPDVLRRVAT